MTPYNLFISKPEKISLDYFVPEYLKGISNIEEMRKIDLDKLDFELKKEGSSLEEKIKDKKIWRMGFPGMILDVQKVHVSHSNEVYLGVVPIHPHRADLTFKKDKTLYRTIFPLTINAVPVTKANEIILGVRGGSVESGKVGVIPGGHIDYEIPNINDVNYGLLKEFEEEIGMKFNPEIHKLSLIGVMGNHDLPGINIINSIKMENSFEEIIESWKKARDNFEHGSIFKVNYQEVSELSKTGKLKKENKNYETTIFFQDCLQHFVDYLKE
jgi:hypothetical protein